MKIHGRFLKSKKFWIASVSVLLLVAVIGGMGVINMKKAEAEAATKAKTEADAEAKKKGSAQSVEAFGVVKARKEQGISVDFNARIDKIYVKVGERITEGQPLIDFDVTELRNTIEDKKSALQELKSSLGNGKYDVIKQRTGLEAARQELKAMEEDLVRNRHLLENAAIAQKAYDDLNTEVVNKRAAVENLAVSLEAGERTMTQSEQEKANSIERTERDIQRMEQKYKEANLTNGSQVVSTFKNGVVSDVKSKEGDYVDREIQIMSIVDMDTRIIEADVSEVYIKNIKVGQDVKIYSDADPEKEYKGKVSRIWGVSQNKGGETIVPVEITIDNIDDGLLLNFNVNVNIFTESTKAK